LAPCVGYQIGLYSDGTYRYNEINMPPTDEERGKIPFAPWADAIVRSEFFRTDLFGHRPRYATALDVNETAVWVGYDSTAREVDLDTAAHDRPLLRHFIQAVSESVAGAREHARQELTRRLTQYQDVQSVQVQVGGCFIPCRAVYDATFDRDGKAHIQNYSPPEDYAYRYSASAFIDFDRVLRILRETNYKSLLREYPFRWSDTPGIRLKVQYRGFIYEVDAPDSTTRPAALTQILGRFDQLVEDITWRPPLPASTDSANQAFPKVRHFGRT
jgi:hypothetical protein